MVAINGIKNAANCIHSDIVMHYYYYYYYCVKVGLSTEYVPDI